MRKEQNRCQRGALSLVLAALLLSSVNAPSYADAAAQARRQTHFQKLRQRGVFESMTVQGTVATLVLGANKDRTEPTSLRMFCRIIFDYYQEQDPQLTRLIVKDSASGAQIGYVDASGYHDGT